MSIARPLRFRNLWDMTRRPLDRGLQRLTECPLAFTQRGNLEHPSISSLKRKRSRWRNEETLQDASNGLLLSAAKLKVCRYDDGSTDSPLPGLCIIRSH